MDLLYAIPLYSFLTNTFSPYDDISRVQDGKLSKNWSVLEEKFKLKNHTRRKSERLKYVLFLTA